LLGGPAVGRELRIRHGEALEGARGEHLTLAVDQARLWTEEHQLADGVGEGRPRRALLLGEALRRVVIGSEQHVERRAVADLGVELAGRAGAQAHPMAVSLLELRR